MRDRILDSDAAISADSGGTPVHRPPCRDLFCELIRSRSAGASRLRDLDRLVTSGYLRDFVASQAASFKSDHGFSGGCYKFLAISFRLFRTWAKCATLSSIGKALPSDSNS
jgi:hypothetical protein